MDKKIILLMLTIVVLLSIIIFIGFNIEPIECYNMSTLDCWSYYLNGK